MAAAMMFEAPGLLRSARVGCAYHVGRGPRAGARVSVVAVEGDSVVTAEGDRVLVCDLGGAPLPPEGHRLVAPLPPFLKVPYAEVVRLGGSRRPGAWHGLRLPGTIEDVNDAAWLTAAFRACGALAADNAVVKVVYFEVLVVEGTYAQGGAGEKAIFDVEYARPDRGLHTRLFAKVPWSPGRNGSWRERVSCRGDCDGREVSVYQFLGQANVLPFETPKLYFADLDRESTDYVLVTERYVFPPSDLEVMLDPTNRKELTAPEPGTVLPHRDKFRDRYDPCPWPLRLEHYYGALMRAQGRLGGVADRGDFGALATEVWGGPPTPHRVHGALYGPLRWARPGALVAGLVAKGLYLALGTAPGRWAVRCAARRIARKGLAFAKTAGLFRALDVNAFEAETLEACGFLPQVLPYLLWDPALTVFAHANLQPDNARFVQGDRKHELHVAPFDWSDAGYRSAPLAFAGTFAGCPHETFTRHEDAFFISYCDELYAHGGRRLDNNDLRDCFRVCDATLNPLAVAYYVGADVLLARGDVDFDKVEHVLHEHIQADWNTRCWVTNLHERVTAHTDRGDGRGLAATKALARREATKVLGALAGLLSFD